MSGYGSGTREVLDEEESSFLGLVVNFHLDYEDHETSIACARDDGGRLTVRTPGRSNLFLRVPAWVDGASVRVTTAGQAIEVNRVGSFVLVPRDLAGGPVVMTYDLPVEEVEEVTDGTTYRFRWRGDDIVGISPNTDYLPFYPTLR